LEQPVILPQPLKNVFRPIGAIMRFTSHIQDFTRAICPVSFFVYICVFGKGNVDWQDICLDIAQTKERLTIKTFDPPPRDNYDFQLFGGFSPKKLMLISRYPMGANPEWIAAN
jgi:hypothetical protein